MKESFSSFKIKIILFLLLLRFGQNQYRSYSREQRRGKYVPGRNINHGVQMDGNLSRSQAIKVQERQKSKQQSASVPAETKFKQFIFTVQGVEQFLLNLPVNQLVAFSLFTYAMQQNSYIRPLNIDNQAPIKVYVFENNNKIIHQSQFYFQNYVKFDGEEGSTYTIRFINSGSQKLIAMNLKKLTQSSHVQQKADKDRILQFSVKTNRLYEQIKYLFNNFQRYSLINYQSVKALLQNIEWYYYWQVFQTVVAAAVCVIQILYIKKICKHQIIV